MNLDTDTGVLTLHQSDIKDFMMCPERFRLSNGIGPLVEFTGETMRTEGDAALAGTTLHHVIERELGGYWFDTLDDMIGFGLKYYFDQVEMFLNENMDWRPGSLPQDPTGQLADLFRAWWTSDARAYWATRNPDSFLIEQYFHVPFLDRDMTPDSPIREVWLAGTPDVVDLQEHKLVDWKSSGRRWERWEHQRWDPQPTAYTYAAAANGWIEPDSNGNYPFEFVVFGRGRSNEVQEITVYRSAAQWGWLAKVCDNIVNMIESDAEEWPVNDTHSLCGPKWCPAWNMCKGAFVNEDWT